MTTPVREALLRVLSAGAAQGLVDSIADDFHVETGARIAGTYSAVGTIRERVLAGEPFDSLILTSPIIAALEKSGHVLPASAMPLGHVKTGIGVRAGEPLPRIATAAMLRKTLVEAAGLFFPDPELATAGIHFMKILRELGIADQVASRLHTFPNGATAMRALAGTTSSALVGCTQITEIQHTPGVVVVGALPPPFELSTLYSAAVGGKAREPEIARRFVSKMTGSSVKILRESAGFE